MEAFDPYQFLEGDDQRPEQVFDDENEPYYMLSMTEAAQASVPQNNDDRKNAQEQQLIDYWSDLLDLDKTKLRPEDNFFDLGGTSVEALKLGAAAHHDGLLLAVPDVFRNPTLSDMARTLQHQSSESEWSDADIEPFTLLERQERLSELLSEAERLCHLNPGMIQDILPCTPLQKGMMALSLLKPGVYVEQHVYTIPGSWELTTFQTAWEATRDANPILRTRIIHTVSHDWVQVIEKSPTQWTDAQSLEPHLALENSKPIEFGQPLIRCALIQGVVGASCKFVLTIHHAIEDGWSLSLIPQKITETYHGINNAPSVKFNSFVKYIGEQDFEASKKYWCCELAGANRTSFPRLPTADYQPMANSRVSHSLRLENWHPSRITTSTMARAAWSMIASRYVDSSDITIGVTMSGRSVPVAGITDMMGPTIATMPVRIRVNREQKLQDFLDMIQHQAMEMIPHEQYSLQNIQSINNDAKTACAFQNLMVVQPMLKPVKFAADEDALQEVRMDFSNYLNYALTLECTLVPNGIEFQIGFDDHVMDDRQVRRIILQFEHVLEQMQLESNWPKKLQELELVSPIDKLEIMGWNAEDPVVQNHCVHSLIESKSLEQPNAPAICAWDGQMSYGELDNLASRYAALLIQHNLGPEIFVPLCFEKSLWTVIAIVAVMKAGSAFVLLDPAQPLNRLKTIVSLVKASIGIASSQHSQQMSNIADTVIVIGPSTVKSIPAIDCMLDVGVKATNALYVTFTSGSTGEPKGSVTTHTSCASAFKAQADAKYFQSTSRVLQFASYAFDASIEEILATLIAGGCICIPSDEERLHNLPAVINRMNVNLVELTSSAASLLSPDSVPGLEILRQGGEPMTLGLINRWANRLKLENSYGPSECCVTSTIQKMEIDADPTNIGKGMNCHLWIAEFFDYTRLAPIGTAGELLIQGPNVARGYLSREVETATAFFEHPLLPRSSNLQAQRLYKTGDVARYNSDGSVCILGRRDGQVKLRGQRIELGEIERQICVNDAVAQSVAVKARDGPFRDEIVAVIQPRDGPGEPNPFQTTLRAISANDVPHLGGIISSLQEHLKLYLPSYMVPSAWITVSHIPISIAGKSNRRAVSDWLEQLSPEDKFKVQTLTPCNATAATLADSEVTASYLSIKLADMISNGNKKLRSELVGRDVLLSSSGLNSISIVTLASYIKQIFDVSISVATLSDSDMTIRQLAKNIDDASGGLLEMDNLIKIDLAGELSKLRQSLLTEIKSSKTEPLDSLKPIQTILVTGATGYLGTHIVKAALLQPQIRKVIAHVRATTAGHGLQRLIDSAVKAGWWTEELLPKLEVWIGDLGAYHLGLTELQWKDLCGTSTTETRVDAIVHNGAAVNWYKDFAALKPANLLSTFDLLCAVASSPTIEKFVYVSGGPQWDGNEDESEESLMRQVQGSTGYCQTKVMSELLTKTFASSSPANRSRVSIVKPGYIIGTASEGVPNVDDFFWRLVAGAINIQSFDEEDADSWLFMATVDTVANKVLGSLLSQRDEMPVLGKILDGLAAGDIWSTLVCELHYTLRPVDETVFSHRLQENVDRIGQKHPLWPVMHLISQGYGKIGSYLKAEQREMYQSKAGEIRAAIISNVEYLVRTGFLPNAQGHTVEHSAGPLFTRN